MVTNKNSVLLGNGEGRWPEGVIVYHIYPRSLQDSNGDGVGDLPGITSRLGYIKDLGVNALWLSPFYPSPMADFGYDVSDYCDVDPLFGTLDDFKDLLKEAHDLDLKVIIDIVPNHTSNKHKWFVHSESSRDSPYDDWYIWRDPKPGSSRWRPKPPNNWLDALTGRSAWEWSRKRKQFYLHSFDVHQPDLNWSNPKVREAIKDVMRFWLRMGVDGFRVDAVYWMAKDPLFRDDATNPNYIKGKSLLYDAVLHDRSQGGSAVYAYLAEMSEILKEKEFSDSARFMITEASPPRHNPLAEYMAFYLGMDPDVAAPFNFEGIYLPWDASVWHKTLKAFHQTLSQFNPHCIASYAFGNHDQPRLVSRMGEAAARSAAVLQLTLPGMIFIYYGEEIGMKDANIPPSYIQDPAAKGDPMHGNGRDPERTPMQWSPEPHAGFSNASKTWLPIPNDYAKTNVEVENADPNSFLSLYKKLCGFRNKLPALRYGAIEVLDVAEPDILAYLRSDGESTYAVFINFSEREATCHPGVRLQKLLVSSDSQSELIGASSQAIILHPHEAALFSVSSLE